MRYIIIGAGPAGITAAETLRKYDREAEILVIGAEQTPPYSRMAIPYLLVKQIDEQGTYLRPGPEYYRTLNITLVQQRVVAIDSAENTLKLDDGQSFRYDKLLIATGSSPVLPPIPGIESDHIFSCWTLDDARNIAASVQPGKRVVLLGAGFIGCIILEALFNCGADLTIVEREDRMVPRMMDAQAAGLIKQWCQLKGIKVMTETAISAIEQKGDELWLSCDHGEAIIADVVVVATGVKPNIDFLRQMDLEIDHGVVVNDCMQTSQPNIYAAGDVAQALDFSSGSRQIQAIQPTATEHGVLAAINMLGLEKAKHQGCINMNVLDTLGLITASFGLWQGCDGSESAESFCPERFQYIKLQFKADVLVGACTVGFTQHIGVLRGLIQGRIQLGPWKQRLMLDPSQIMEAYLACTQVIGE